MTDAEISPAGYDDVDIGSHVGNWQVFEFQDGSNNKIIRITTADPRVTQLSADKKKVVYQVLLQGTDSDLLAKVPVTFNRVVFRATDTDNGTILGISSTANRTLQVTGDVLSLTIAAGYLY